MATPVVSFTVTADNAAEVSEFISASGTVAHTFPEHYPRDPYVMAVQQPFVFVAPGDVVIQQAVGWYVMKADRFAKTMTDLGFQKVDA